MRGRVMVPCTFGTSRTKVLLAVLTLTHPTLDGLADETGLVKSTVQAHLQELRRDGLVDWVDGRKGTLHATCRVVSLCTS